MPSTRPVFALITAALALIGADLVQAQRVDQDTIKSVVRADTEASRHGAQPSIDDQSDATNYMDRVVQRSDTAIENCQWPKVVVPNLWRAYDRLGRAYAAVGDVRRAIECYTKSVTLNPEHEAALTALMRLQNQDAVRRSSPRSQP